MRRGLDISLISLRGPENNFLENLKRNVINLNVNWLKVNQVMPSHSWCIFIIFYIERLLPISRQGICSIIRRNWHLSLHFCRCEPIVLVGLIRHRANSSIFFTYLVTVSVLPNHLSESGQIFIVQVTPNVNDDPMNYCGFFRFLQILPLTSFLSIIWSLWFVKLPIGHSILTDTLLPLNHPRQIHTFFGPLKPNIKPM